MKTLLLCLLLAAPETGGVADSLIAMERQSWEAWQHGDGEFFQRFLSDDHLEVGPGGSVGKAEVVAYVGAHRCTVKSWAVRDFKVTLFSAQTAAVTYHAEQDTMCGTYKVPSPVWATSVYVLRDGRWQNAVYQHTPSPK
jgi:hypothetical protein